MTIAQKRGAALLAAVAAAWLAAPAPARAQGLAGVTQGPDPALYVISPDTGAAARVGSVTGAGPADQMSALTVRGTSYLAGSLLGNLYQISASSAATTLLGGTGNANPVYGLAFLDGTLYGIQNDPFSGLEDLERLSFGGAGVTASVIGSVVDGGGNPLYGRGLAVYNGALVTADAGTGAGGYLYSLDTATGLGTSLDTTGGAGIPLNGVAGLAAVNGTLYAGDNDASAPDYALYRMNPVGSTATGRADLGGLRLGALAGPALPAGAAVPEAGALWLLAPGLGLLGLLAARRRRPVSSGAAAALALLPLALLPLALLPLAAQAQAPDPLTYPAPTGPAVLPPPPGNPVLATAANSQLITGKRLTLPPLGTQTNVGSLPFNLVLSPDGKYAVSSDTGFREFLIAVKTGDGTETSSVPFGDAHGGYVAATKEGLFYGLAFGPALNADGTYTLYAAQGNKNTVAVLKLNDATGALTDTGTRFHGNSPASPTVNVPGVGTVTLNALFGVPPIDTPAGLALDGQGGLYVANNDAALPTVPSSVSLYSTATNAEVGRYTFPPSPGAQPNYPFSVAALADGSKVFVGSERDGVVYVLTPGDFTDPAPHAVPAIRTGSHPLALTFARNADGTTNYARLYVANAQSDTVSVVNTSTNAVTATVLLRPQGALGLPGVTPNGLAVSPDGRTLYATLADMNAVAVIDAGRSRLLGYIPVGWYPTAVVVSPDNRNLLVTNAKGHYTRYPNPAYGTALANSNSILTYDENMIEGDIQTLAVPSPAALAADTQMTLANNRITPLTDNPPTNPLAGIGLQSGKIRHVLYIVKENRTYDQVLGDLKDGPTGATGNPLGNGEADLDLDTAASFITPNLHALARRFVLLDNYYEGGEVSEDGWNWSTQGMANEFTVRNVPYNYSNRNYFTQTDFQGQNNGYPVGGFPAGLSVIFPLGAPAITDIAQGPGGYIWDDAQRAGLSYRNYGVDVSTGAAGLIPDNYPTHAGQAPGGRDLAGKTDYDFRRFDTNFPDSDAPYLYAYGSPPATVSPATGSAYALPAGPPLDKNAQFNETKFGSYNAPSRFSEFRREFGEMLANGTPARPDAGVPAFMTMTIMSDHTQGNAAGSAASPNIHSAKSMIADNDYGVGQMVDLISHNRAVWDSTAIFIIEDDSQDGPDHVDTHRSICYAISPWINQGAVDSHFYNTDSVLKTMELLLGLPAMNQYDAVADPILDWKTSIVPGSADDAPYTAILPAKNVIDDLNPTMLALKKLDPKSLQYRLAMLCSKMDFKRPDAAPEELLNMAIWKSIKGWDAPVPAPVHGLTVAAKTHPAAPGHAAKRDDD